MAFESLVTIATLHDLTFVNSKDIWLALEEDSDIRRDDRQQLMELDWLKYSDAKNYQTQLFYWLLIRRPNSNINVELMMICPELFNQVLKN